MESNACHFNEEFNNYSLEGRSLQGSDPRGRTLFAIHGARSDYTKLDPLLLWLQSAGIGSLSFNLSGHGATSPVPLHRSSLAANLMEASRFYSRGAGADAVLGQSMGGALALKVAEANEAAVKKLVLICPAIYPEAAYGPHFGPDFTAAISTPYGFMDSSSIAFLRRFKGDVMLIVGEHDGLRASDFGKAAGRSAGQVPIGDRTVNSAIPYEVLDAIESAVSPARICKVVLPGCDHQISTWLREDASRVRDLGTRLLEFLG